MVALRTVTYDEPVNISDFLKHEINQEYCREVVTIASGQAALKPGAVLGKLTKGAASSAAKSGGNTGNGTLTLDATTPILAGAIPGVYQVRCIQANPDAGLFEVRNPNGVTIGLINVGATAFANQIKFVLADGSTDFAVSDGFDVTIAAGSGKWKEAAYDAVTGLEKAAAILLQPVDASAADKPVVVIARGDAVVSRLGLRFGSTYDSEAKKDAACAQLAALGIITRASA